MWRFRIWETVWRAPLAQVGNYYCMLISKIPKDLYHVETPAMGEKSNHPVITGFHHTNSEQSFHITIKSL